MGSSLRSLVPVVEGSYISRIDNLVFGFFVFSGNGIIFSCTAHSLGFAIKSSYDSLPTSTSLGLAHGALLMNNYSNDVSSSKLTYKVIGGLLDFYFAGLSPSDVVQQFTDLIGHTTAMPYWASGMSVHALLCSFLV
ncbi:hypothetical protein SUGI_1075920 [Cryptomeria japonica]|nr:hypothetical protein SUGI_1075920 [Cryptomeria japonica]